MGSRRAIVNRQDNVVDTEVEKSQKSLGLNVIIKDVEKKMMSKKRAIFLGDAISFSVIPDEL